MTAVARIRQRDVQALVRGALAAGLVIGRIEITPEGRIIVSPAAGNPAPTGDGLEDELAAWRAANGDG